MNIEKAARKFAISLYKNEDRKGIAGANYYNDNRDPDVEATRQYLCDGIIAVIYQNPVDEIVEADLEKAVDMNQIIERKKKYHLEPASVPTYKELKLLLDVAKEKGIKKKEAIVRIHSGQFYNLWKLTTLYELLDFQCDWENGEYAEVEDNRLGSLFLHKWTDERGEIDGVVMPIAPGRMNPAHLVKDYTLEGE